MPTVATAPCGCSVAELPESWGLRTQQRADGKLDIIGRDDAGSEYRVRTTDGDHVTERDLCELHAADREAYTSREAGARAFCNALCPREEKVPMIDQALAFDDCEWIGAAEPVVAAGFGRRSFGSTHNYRAGYQRWLTTLED